jgi:hypothetical protein
MTLTPMGPAGGLPHSAGRINMGVHTRHEAAGRHRHRRVGRAGRVCHLQPRVIDRRVRIFHRWCVDERASFIDGVVGRVRVADEEAIAALRAVVSAGSDDIRRADAGNANDVDIANRVQRLEAVPMFQVARLTVVTPRSG